MRYLHAMVRVENLDASLHFYCDLLGLSETKRYDSEQGRFTLVYLAAPQDLQRAEAEQSPLIELTYNWPPDDGEPGSEPERYTGGRNFGHLAFAVDDIYALCSRLVEHGVVINRPPRDGRMAFVRSPDGISIELLQSGDALEPQEPWASMESVGSW